MFEKTLQRVRMDLEEAPDPCIGRVLRDHVLQHLEASDRLLQVRDLPLHEIRHATHKKVS